MSGVSTIGQSTFINAQIQNIETQLNTLSDQVSSGKKSTTFSGINAVSQLSLQLTNANTVTTGYLTNITNATTLVSPTQSVLQQITDIANSLRTTALSASSDALPVTQGNSALQAQASDALNQISALLNTKVGDTYLFGGQKTSTPPMPNFGSLSNAGSMIGQTAALSNTTPLTSTAQSGNTLYDAIQNFLNNGVTTTTVTGATAPSAFGYAGQTGAPGGDTYNFTTTAAVAQGSTQITVAQGTDLPTVGQYIEFGTVPPTNAAYQVTNVTGQTITFQRATSAGTLAGPPAVTVGPTPGLDFNIPAGTSVNVISPAAVTTVAANGAQVTDTIAQTTTASAALGANTVTVGDAANFTAGQTIQFAGDPGSYLISAVNPATGQLTLTTGLGVASVAGTTITTTAAGVTLPVGSTQIPVGNIANYNVGDRIQFASNPGTYYDVTGVDSSTGLINISQVAVPPAAGGGGLAAPFQANSGTDQILIDKSYQAGTNTINVGSTAGVTAGMSVKFSNSNITYTVSAVVNGTQIQIVPLGTGQGSGLDTTMPPPETTVPGQTTTASFGPPIQPLSVQIDNGVSLSYGIAADSSAFRKVLGAIFALATTNLNTTTQGGFRQVAARAAADLATGSAQVSTLASNLGVKQQTITANQTRLQDFQTTLNTQLSSLDDVDMASAVSKLTQTQTQLQASFQLLSTMKSLTLANYI